MSDERRLIEDFLPIQAISAEASREKSIRKGHISTLHLWWARRPLVACRAAVYGALVPASRFVPENGPDNKKQSLGRANAAKFVTRLCRYPSESNPEQCADINRAIKEARQHILEAHAERLTREAGEKITVQDIEEGRARRPKVLDMFAGGGAIPLEALRLGCDAYALDLNPVAHIIELCTLVYPQKYGRPDSNARGMTGPKNAKGEATWGGLADEVRYWGDWVLQKVKAEIGDLYPAVPDPKTNWGNKGPERQATMDLAKGSGGEIRVSPGHLIPVAYLWTRTVRCENPSCRSSVPLVRQTWLCKKKERYVALKMVTPDGTRRVRFEVVEDDGRQLPEDTEWVKELKSKDKNITDSKLHERLAVRHFGFDPADFSKGGNATCRFCPSVVHDDYVKAEGSAKRMGQEMMAVVCRRPGKQGKVYLPAHECRGAVPDDEAVTRRIQGLCQRTGLDIPSESIVTDAKNSCWTYLYGLSNFGDLFTNRQTLYLLTCVSVVRQAHSEMLGAGYERDHSSAIATYLGVLVDRQADYCSSVCVWESGGQFIKSTFAQKGIPLVWDFVEMAPFGDASGSPQGAMDWIIDAIESLVGTGNPAEVVRGSALSLPWPDNSIDSAVTDPPYYDNVPYADISDFFYVWLKRAIGHIYPEHFASDGTPKKAEAVADAVRHGGNKEKARQAYEDMMVQSFTEANRVLRPLGDLVVVYAHKTTRGWATLVDALRRAGFTVSEAWPLDTERPGRVRAIESAALASSIFLVARKRESVESGSYEDGVRPELDRIVRERVDSLWKMRITGADLVIAAVGAGLRAFTRFARVEYANGEEVPAERFLAEVEGVVLETLLEKIFGVSGKGVAAVDGPSRFYVLWRHTYGVAEMDAGEAIVFTYGQNVELDGPNGLSAGSRALVRKKKGSYLLRDFSERGEDDNLGLPKNDGSPAPLIDALHRILWLLENQPRKLNEFLDEARPDRERLRLVAQALAGTSLVGKKEEGPEQKAVTTAKEQSALNKLVANWRSLIDSRLADIDSKTGQQRLPI